MSTCYACGTPSVSTSIEGLCVVCKGDDPATLRAEAEALLGAVMTFQQYLPRALRTRIDVFRQSAGSETHRENGHDQ